MLFWKNAWLKPVEGPATVIPGPSVETAAPLEQLQRATRAPSPDEEVRYRCQATELVPATAPISTTSPGHFYQDVVTRNVSLTSFVRHFSGAVWKIASNRLVKRIGRSHTGPSALRYPSGPKPQTTSNTLGLQSGETVQVRSAEEIAATLDENWKNRGLTFEEEMLRHCGRICRVVARVSRIIDERSGRMLTLKNDCIILEGLTCSGLDNRKRLFCPKAPYWYWREAWLRRLPEDGTLPDGAGSESISNTSLSDH
jgi:hypothetical protein